MKQFAILTGCMYMHTSGVRLRSIGFMRGSKLVMQCDRNLPTWYEGHYSKKLQVKKIL